MLKYIVLIYESYLQYFIIEHTVLFIHILLYISFFFILSQGSGPEHEHIFCTPVDMKLLGHKNADFKFHHKWLLFYASTLHL